MKCYRGYWDLMTRQSDVFLMSLVVWVGDLWYSFTHLWDVLIFSLFSFILLLFSPNINVYLSDLICSLKSSCISQSSCMFLSILMMYCTRLNGGNSKGVHYTPNWLCYGNTGSIMHYTCQNRQHSSLILESIEYISIEYETLHCSHVLHAATPIRRSPASEDCLSTCVPSHPSNIIVR
jgi:hypothetical protein